MEAIVANSEYIWTTDDEIGRLIEGAELPKDYDTQKLHAKICQKTSKSPLCEDIEILRRIDSIAREK